MSRHRIVPERSRVWIDAHSNVHPIQSTTDGLEGFVDLDVDVDASGAPSAGPVAVGDNPTAKLSLPVAQLSSGNRFEDRELQKRIEARRYPTIDGALTSMKADGEPDRFVVTGELTFRGVTQSYEDSMTVTWVDPTTLKLNGEATFDIRDFGMEPPKILMLRVEPEVAVRVEIIAMRED